MEQGTLFDTGSPAQAKLGGKAATAREWECIQAGLDEFNLQAGTRLGALRGDGRLSDAGTRIGMRARQWPALGPEDMREIVRRGFARPWWRGRPSPGVIFNPGIFEGLLGQRDSAPPMDEFDEYLASLQGDDAIEGHAEEIR